MARQNAGRAKGSPRGLERVMLRNKNGFTLIEVMIVVAIIAVLAMIAVPIYQGYLERSRESATQSLLQNLALAEMTLKTEPTLNQDFITISGTDSATLDNVETLGQFGFRPDPNVGFAAFPFDGELPGGFILFAAYASVGGRIFVFNFVPRNGVRLMDPSAPYSVALPATLHVYQWQSAAKPAVKTLLDVDTATGTVTKVTEL